jgi:thioredoxin-related protein
MWQYRNGIIFKNINKMKYTFILISILLLYSCKENVYQCIFDYIEKEKIIDNYKIIIFADFDCDYCQIALKELKPMSNRKDLIIIVFVFNTKKENFDELQSKYVNYIFADEDECKTIKQLDLFPTLILFDKNNNMKWKKEGWFKENIKQIENKLDNI